MLRITMIVMTIILTKLTANSSKIPAAKNQANDAAYSRSAFVLVSNQALPQPLKNLKNQASVSHTHETGGEFDRIRLMRARVLRKT